VDSAFAGRAYAAYGGIYIAASLVWLWLVEGQAAGGCAELALIMRTYGMLPKHQTKHRRNGNDPNRHYFWRGRVPVSRR
jgi:hypothetical protein